jgi:hypothetical protein
MSLYALSWAFEQKLPPNEKIVLLALADCENGETLRCDPKQAYIAERASVSERQVRAMLVSLEERGLVQRARRGGSGEGRKSDNYRLGCRPEPVDNGGLPAESAGRATGRKRGGNRQTVAGIENRKEPEETNGPVPNATTEGPVDNSAATVFAGRDGRASTPATPTTLARLHGHAVSTPDVFASVGEILAPTHIDDEGLLRLADEILRKATARVLNPTAFVVAALRNPASQFEWVARAWVIAGDIHLERAAGRKAS